MVTQLSATFLTDKSFLEPTPLPAFSHCVANSHVNGTASCEWVPLSALAIKRVNKVYVDIPDTTRVTCDLGLAETWWQRFVYEQ